jgi:hypothetical protein
VVGLLAPSGPAAAVAGSGPGDVAETLPWDAPRFASLLDDDGPADDVRAAFRQYDTAIAYTRNDALVRGLRRIIPTVIARDPTPPAGGPHASRWLAGCLPDAGVAVVDDVPVLAPSDDDQRRADDVAQELPPHFLALHPGSGSPSKNWPASRFAEIAKRFGGEGWLLVRGPADGDAVAVLEAIPGARVARDLPLRVLAAVLGRAGVYVGNDSGISHLAAATGAPTVTLFGPTDPRLWSPIGPRVTVLASGGMESISVDGVSAAVAAVRQG